VPFKVGILKAIFLISLRYLENGRSLDGWSAYGSGSISLANDQPLSAALPAHLKFSLTSSSTSSSGFTNGGFFGIKVEAQTYNASFFYKPLSGASVGGGKLTIGLRNSDGSVTFGSTSVDVSGASVDKWSNFLSLITVTSAAPSVSNQLFIEFPPGSNGDFEFNLISCFPPTFKNRINGARKDIAQVFADLKLGFVRLPGGNDVEGRSIPERFIWNETIGPLENRPGRRGSWVGYNTEGFGLIELMTFVEDIGALPLLAVYAGYSLDGRSVPENQLQPYIDEVVDEINFLTASATENSMGALRARLGRSKPFDIRYVEIGNEDGGRAEPTYRYRWPDFYKALSQRFPNITFIATTSRGISSPPAVDDHDYNSPEFFIQNFRRYENVPRPTPKVLVGEFAVVNTADAQNKDSKIASRLQYPSVTGAVAESVYRIGFERNSDIVIGGAYAPVLQNVHSTQWIPNLILFDASMVVKSTSHLAQQIFGQHLGNLLLNSTASNGTIAHENVRKGGEGDGKLGNLYFVATKDTNINSLIVKFANVDGNDITVNAQIQGSSTSFAGVAYILSAGPGVDPATAYNTLENPNAITIKNASVSVSSGIWSVTVPSWGVVVVTIPL
jgi:alpha-N-arabinofuranosidase